MLSACLHLFQINYIKVKKLQVKDDGSRCKYGMQLAALLTANLPYFTKKYNNIDICMYVYKHVYKSYDIYIRK